MNLTLSSTLDHVLLDPSYGSKQKKRVATMRPDLIDLGQRVKTLKPSYKANRP